MVHSVFISPATGSFDVEAVNRHLEAKPDVFLDPLGTPTYVLCGGTEAVEVRRNKRIERPDRFPYAVLVRVKPDEINVFQEYGDKYDLRSARDFVRWLLEQQPCTIQDEYSADWTERVRREGVDVLYPPRLDVD